MTGSASLFRSVREAAGGGFPRPEIRHHAWLLEAEGYLWSGQPEEAWTAISQLLTADDVPTDIEKRGASLALHLAEVVLPSTRWFDSVDAKAIARSARTSSLREAVATEVAPLVSWWSEWNDLQGDGGPRSELLDFWGRGGFSRVASAVRARPHAAIAVDARSIGEIRRWAWTLCPLFDTVLVKWKGIVHEGLVMTPLRVDYGGPGGHGYRISAGLNIRKDWTLGMSWANPLPRDLVDFLATEALPLVASGRLVVLPAPSVGCTQSSVGWTDHLLLDGLLGGVVNVVSGPESGEGADHRRVLDLATNTLPYVADIGLSDLATVLEDAEDWVRPLRSLLFRSLSSDDLRTENWQAIAALENDIQDACRQLRVGLVGIAKAGGWRVEQTEATVVAAPSDPEQRGYDPVTALLRSIVTERRDLAPWIPYWRLQERGGHLDWSRPLDNPSKLDPEAPSTKQAWLYPGTAGWYIPIVIG